MEEIIVAGIVVALYELLAHYFPWEMWLRRKLSRVSAYIIGTLGIVACLLVLFWYWQLHQAFWAVIAVVCAAGGAVIVAYKLDHIRDRLIKAVELEERYAKEEAQGRSS